MQITGTGTLAVEGELRADVAFTLTTSAGFAAGCGELHGDPAALEAAFNADCIALLHCIDWGDPLAIMLVGEPDGAVADFVPVGESPRFWSE